MRIRAAHIGILLGLLAFSRAEAASPALEELVRPKALLDFQGIEQSVTFLYDYSGIKESSTSNSTSQFQEKYHVRTDVVVFDPNLLQMSLGGDVGLTQSKDSEGGGSGFNYQYLVSASLLPYDPYPIDLLNSRSTALVTAAFMPNYTVTTSTSHVGARLLNTVLPLNFSYNHSVFDTSGQVQDSVTTTDNLELHATNNYHNRSVTEAAVSYNGAQSELTGLPPQDSRTYTISASNGLTLDQANRYTLATTFSMSDSEQTGIPQRTVTFGENLAANFGQALQGRLIFLHDYNRTVGFDQSVQLQQTDGVTASLTHQLFRSITTTIQGRYQQYTLTGGEETDMGGSIGVGYQKILPAKSLFKLSLGADRTYVDRNSALSQIAVRNEVHKSVNQGDVITLSRTGNLGSVVSVQSRRPDTTYLETRDYDVSLPLGTITIRKIVDGGTIPSGTDLYISYTLLQDPVAQYYTDGRTISSSISLFENRYQFLAEAASQTQTVTSGNSTTLNLLNSSSYRLHFDANYVENAYSAELASQDTGQTKSTYYSGSWRYMKRLATADVSLNAQERYTVFDAGSAGTKGSTLNEIGGGGSWSRSLSTWARITLSANYSNSVGDNGFSQFGFLRGHLQGRVNLLQFSLSGQTNMRVMHGVVSRDDSVNLAVTRFF